MVPRQTLWAPAPAKISILLLRTVASIAISQPQGPGENAGQPAAAGRHFGFPAIVKPHVGKSQSLTPHPVAVDLVPVAARLGLCKTAFAVLRDSSNVEPL